jgi:uncharacterized protein (TIGR02246 family)
MGSIEPGLSGTSFARTVLDVFRGFSASELIMNKITPSRIVQVVAALFWGFLGLVPAAIAQEQTARDARRALPAVAGQGVTRAALSDRPDDEKAIRAMADAFARSFAASDAKAIAAMFSENAELISENGERWAGQRAIEQFYRELFQARPSSTIDIAIDSLTFLSREVAKEEGHTRVNPAGEPETLRHYTVLYTRKDRRWLYSSVHEEHARTVAHHEHLKPLGWLVGEWIDQSSDSTVQSSCRWSPDKNFLLRDFTVHVQGRPVMTVEERIGYDPLSKRIKGWVFDSEGGYGEEFWARKGNQWVIKSTGVLPDGRTASATHVLAPAGANSARWSSTERTVGDQCIGEPAEHVMVRRAPAPQTTQKP